MFRWLIIGHRWLGHRPAWDALLWLLSLCGIVVSIGSIVIGGRRLRA